MSLTNRQNRLLVAEDWKRIYQSYQNADFKSYDFDNLRRTMINYLRNNYPEDFNDYIETTEYLALIDVIAFLGQNLAFRIDLNARENYLELAERRESVLRLARLLSYNPKRNIAANGLLRVSSIKTTESITDSNNINLKNQAIVWNDSTNTNWYGQFIKILNRALPINGVYGKPTNSGNVLGIQTEKYSLNSIITGVPKFTFTRNINGRSVPFEVVSANIVDNFIYEEDPLPGNAFSLLYRDDNKGTSSINSGFFAYFKQGSLQDGTFIIDNPSTNQTVAIDATNINDTDIWLYKLDSDGNEEELWTKVAAVEGNNVIYNSLSKNVRNIYSVLTRIDDRISLIFSDGVFGDLPRGNFRIYYRTSANANLVINPRDFAGISIDIYYISRTNVREKLTLTFDLKYTIENASQTEDNNSIKLRAPANYYTQNRLVTAEDYQLGPLISNQQIVKVKSVNRIASGISRYFDITDATGKYSKTNLFGVDGVLYYERLTQREKFTFSTQTDIENIILNVIEPIINKKSIRNFYYNNFTEINTTDLEIYWRTVETDTNLTTGYFVNVNELKQTLGTYTNSILQLIRINALLKFIPPAGYHFTPDNKIKLGSANYFGSKEYLWTKTINVIGNGTELVDGSGPVYFNDVIPDGAKLTQIIPALATTIIPDIQRQIIDQIFAKNAFGLRYDRTLGQWLIVTNENLNLTDDFSIGKEGDVTNQKLDASWLLKFTTDSETYLLEYRGSRYIFESDKEIRFYYDSTDKIYNSLTGKTVKDRITILNNNNRPDSINSFTNDIFWEITEEYRDPTGYINTKKIQVTFFDNDDDGVVDDPDIFAQVISPKTNVTEKYIFQKKYLTSDGAEDYNYIENSNNIIIVKQNKSTLGALSVYNDGQIFYFIDTNTFETYNKSLGITEAELNYKGFLGRDKLKFHYVHAADDSTRIDPSVTNIIDVYMLTRTYDTEYRRWLTGATDIKPLPLSSDELYVNFGNQINQTKSLTDEVIYHPVKYRPLFGSKADPSLQVKFKIVKNPELVLNDNDIKSRVINLFSTYFALDNWEFGDTFYFSELAAYIIQEMSPDIVTFVIVPESADQSFGSLYEIKSELDEVLISAATVNDLEIIDALTASKINATGTVLSSTQSSTTGIQSL